MKVWILTLYYKWVYRNVDEDLCCCGSTFRYDYCGGGLNVCRSAKEYAITTSVGEENHYED